MKMQYKCHCPNLFFYMSCFEDADVLLLNVALNPLTHSLRCHKFLVLWVAHLKDSIEMTGAEINVT